MGNMPKSAQDPAVNRPADKIHLDELLDAALAGTFPASDPVAGLSADRAEAPLAGAPAQGRPASNEGKKQADQ